MDTKVCSRCKEEKSVDLFCKSSRMKDGYQSACKSCMNVSWTNSRKKKQKHYQQVAKDRESRNTQRIREWKSEQGCILCGETFAQCLELHHLDPTTKEFDLAESRNKGWETFIVEADKCVILCANCHRKVHALNISLIERSVA